MQEVLTERNRLRSRSKEATATGATVVSLGVLSLGLSACGAGFESESRPTATTTVTVTAKPLLAGEATHALMAEDAPINLIFVPVEGEETKTDWDELLKGDEDYEDVIVQGFETATAGEYRPSDVLETQAQAVSPSGCISAEKTVYNDRLEARVEKYKKDSTIDIVIINKEGCVGEAIAYASQDGIILTKDALNDYEPNSDNDDSAKGALVASSDKVTEAANEKSGNKISFYETMIHEVGHLAGLGHAGMVECDNPEELAACEEVSPTSDSTSTMSYEHVNERIAYSTTELYKLGLLDHERVLNSPDEGLYTMADPQLENQEDTQLMTFQDEEKGTIYLTWEKNPEAEVSQDCFDDTLGTECDGEEGKHSLQMRFDADETSDFTALVLKDDIRPERLDQPIDGISTEDRVVYENENGIKVTFVGTDGEGQAIVKVERHPDEQATDK